MDLKPVNIFGLGNSKRDVVISRRGGVRTRGGRLPPIQMRDFTQKTGSKKVVPPNIPQRRVAVKKEGLQTPIEPLKVKTEAKSYSQQKRGRSAKVILQTGGTFLAEGPAARIKRDPTGLSVGFSRPRISAKKEESWARYDSETIKHELDSYEENQFCEDDFCAIPPYRLPLLKSKPVTKIKSEPDDGDDCEVKIKREVTEDADSPELKTDVKKPLEYFQNVKSDGMLILLKMPSVLPFAKQTDEKNSEDQVKEKESEEEGLIGKLQFMRSGRMKMVLGGVELELLDTISSESYMEAATIRVHEDGADLFILDKIDKIMVLSPILDGFVERSKQLSSTCSN